MIPLWLIGMVAISAGLARAQPLPDAASLDRIRERLLQPPGLLLVLPRADFTIHIEQRRPLQDIFDRPPWVSPPPEFPPPPGSNRDPHNATVAGIGFNWLDAAHAVSRAVRAHQARSEVERAIADYCIAHRDEPGADAICAEPFR